ncbi:MAG: hypothetical protein ACLFUS_14435 [Candidatus Sumerlaeia bacterium]
MHKNDHIPETPEDRTYSNKRAKWAFVLFLIGLAWLIIVWVQLVQRQKRYEMGQFEKGKMELRIKAREPMLLAALTLTNRHGIPLRYEAPRHSDTTTSATVAMKYDVEVSTSQPKDYDEMLGRLIDIHNRKSGMPEFQSLAARAGSGYHLVPQTEWNAEGEAVPARPILGTPMDRLQSFDPDMDALEAVHRILDETWTGEKIDILPGGKTFPLSELKMDNIRTARDALVQILEQIEGDFSFNCLWHNNRGQAKWDIQIFAVP